MPKDPLERVYTLLEKHVDPLALLLDLTSLLPESLLKQAIWLAEHASGGLLQAFLVRELAKHLPTKTERVELTKQYPVPSGAGIKEVSIPEGKEAKRLVAKLDEQQRQEVFEQLLNQAGGNVSAGESTVTEHEGATGGEEVFRGALTGTLPAASKSDVEWINTGGGGGGGDSSWDGEVVFVEPVDPEGVPVDDDDRGAAASVIRVPSQVATGYESDTTKEEETEARTDLVNLGFADATAADKRVSPNETLETGKSYYFWLKIGALDKDAIGPATWFNFDKLPDKGTLTVAIFGFENELEIIPGKDVGELKFEDRSVKVLLQPTGRKKILLSPNAEADYLKDNLLFPIRVPDKEGVYRLRCNIYCSQVLVQSYLMSANVRATPTRMIEAYTRKLDYVLSQSLRASHLASLARDPHRLSLMLNNNSDGTHSFRFFGADGKEQYKDDAQIDGPQLAGFLFQARRAMHKVSWDNEDPWDPKKGLKYRYQDQVFKRDRLVKDLAYLARAGWRIYAGFVSHLNKTAADLETLLANPGLVQVALKLSPRAVLPAAIVYDYPWRPEDFNFDTTEFQLCPTFSAAIDQARADGPPLEECECFKGGCALKQMIAEIRHPDSDKTLADLPPMICPSGFWGYRHLLGLPLTLDGINQDIPPVINFKHDVQMVACVSTDPNFTVRDPHLGRLKALKSALKIERDDGYNAIIKRLKKTAPHLLYFYCHGGIRANTELPYLGIGADDKLGPEAFIGEGISWKEPHPLVFINGCHTTSLNPEITLDFVSSFVQQSGAAGVVGTEITIFEPLAAKFAEECLSRFIGAPPHNESMPLGKAVRGARLALLQQGNPLGLVYIPYAVASLRLQESQN